MRKLIIIGLFSVLALSACGSTAENEEQGNTDTQTNGQAETETPTENAATGNTDTQEAGEIIMYPQLSKEIAADEALVVMHTTMGDIKIKLFPELAPKAVENFLTHAEEGYYDGIIFHRVIEDFMIQGGDPTGTGMGGESIYGEEFEDEFSMQLFNLRGALSMANAGPNTNGSQFFIVQAKQSAMTEEQLIKGNWPEEIAKAYVEMGGTPHLDQKHTVFGQVIEGMDVVDEIAAVEKDANDKPKAEVSIKSIEVIQK